MVHLRHHKRFSPQRWVSLAFILLCAFTAFKLFHISLFWHTDSVDARQPAGMSVLLTPDFEEILDDTAPQGTRSVLSLTLPQIPAGCNTLAFYTIHHEIRVTLDGELLYSLECPAQAPFDTTGYNWTLLPISQEDSGAALRIELTPLYDAVRGRPVRLLMGSQHAVYMDRIMAELTLLLLSLLAIIIGVAYIAISPVMRLRRHTDNSLCYLGASSLFLGLFKLTDLQIAPLIFTGGSVALSYISLAALPLAALAMVFYVRGLYGKVCPMPLNVVCLLLLALNSVQFLLDVLNIASMRETLPLCHILLGLCGATIVLSLLHQYRLSVFGRKKPLVAGCIACCVLGLIIDLVRYYTVPNPESMSFSLIAFLLLVVLSGSASFHELSQRAHLDMQTDLYNKASCEEQLCGVPSPDDPTGIMMFDLNGLKRINDTWGHEAGDELIESFAQLLRSSMPAGTFIGRFGGDEFIAILRRTTHAQLIAAMDSLRTAVWRHNARSGKAPVSYAGGYVLSTDFPNTSMTELLKQADQLMYEEKRRQHGENA